MTHEEKINALDIVLQPVIENSSDGLAVFKLPENMKKRLRTTNMTENLNRQIRRRTRTASLFPNETSLLRLVTAVVNEISDEWEAGNVYLNVKGMKL